MYVCIIVSITCIIASVHFCVCVIGITSRRKWGRYPRSVWTQLVTEFSRHVDIFLFFVMRPMPFIPYTHFFVVPVVVVPCGKCVSFVYFLFRFLFFFFIQVCLPFFLYSIHSIDPFYTNPPQTTHSLICLGKLTLIT